MAPWEIAITIGAVITAASVVWTKVLRPVLAAANAVADSAPILREIARDFNGNGHSNLSQRLDSIEGRAEDARLESRAAREDVTDLRQIVMNTVETGAGDRWRLDQDHPA